MEFGVCKQRLVQGRPSFPSSSIEMAKIGRNEPCPCGSGKKYKQCCLATDEAAESAHDRRRPGGGPLAAPSPALLQELQRRHRRRSQGVMALIDAGKLDDAEQAAQAIVSAGPTSMTDTIALAWSARPGAITVRQPTIIGRSSPWPARIPALYEPQFQEYYQKLIGRLDPATHGGSAPKPPGYLKPSDDQVKIFTRYRRGRR